MDYSSRYRDRSDADFYSNEESTDRAVGRKSRYDPNAEKPVSLGWWLGMMIVMIIPYINIVLAVLMAIVGPNSTVRNFYRAMFIMGVIVTILVVILFIALSQVLS